MSDDKIRANISADARPASDTIKGIVRLATEQEAIEGTNNTAVITPYTLKKAMVSSDLTYDVIEDEEQE